MSRKKSFVPHWFKYIDTTNKRVFTGDIFKKSSYKEFINIPVGTSGEVSNRSVAFFLDGIFYPTTTGQSYHVMTLLNALAKKKVVPYLFRCYRGWEDPSVYRNFAFNTVCFEPVSFYNALQKTVEVLKAYKIVNVVFDTAEIILRQGSYLKNEMPELRIVYDVPNIDPILSKKAGLSSGVVENQRIELVKAKEYVDCYWVKSETDARYIRNLGVPTSQINCFGVGIDLSKIHYLERKKFHKPLRCVFLGNMCYPPNREGLGILKTVVAECLERDIILKFDIIGDYPHELAQRFTEFSFRGKKESLNKALSPYDIAFACPTYGSGMSLKVLDYMANGLPVIANDVGIRGHDLSIRQCVLLYENCMLYKGIVELLRDRDLARKLSKCGRAYVSDHYDIEKKIDGVIENLR